MTVPTYCSREDYTGNGVTTSYPYQFRIYKASDLVVTRATPEGVETTLVLNTDYTVTGVGKYAGGNVVLTSALASGYHLAIERVLPVTQETDLRNQGAYFAETHEDVFDRLIMLLQRIASYLGLGPDGAIRTLLLGKTDIDGQGAYRARQNRIQDLGDPVNMKDAANKQWTLAQIAASFFDGVGNALLQLLGSSDPDKGVALVKGAAKYVDTIMGVNSTGLPDGISIMAKGRSAVGDDGGGPLRYVAGSTQTVDNIFVFAPAGGGRLFREGWTIFGFNGDVDVAWGGAQPRNTGDALEDCTATVNAVISAAFQLHNPTVMASGCRRQVIKFGSGRDYTVLGTILVPSGILVDLNGSRLVGADATAGTTAYSSSLQSMFKTARWNGTALVSNEDAPNETTYRILNAGVVNGSFLNVGCPTNFVNFQEFCELDGLYYDNVSAPFRLKNSFYARIGNSRKLLARNSSLAAGQPAFLLYGVAAHDLYLDISAPSASITLLVTATNSFRVELNGSFEEGYANNSIGLLNSGAYCQSWKVHVYCEGVRVGIKTDNGGTFNASDFTPSHFSSTEYAVKAGVSGFRGCDFDALSAPDEGVGIRNLMDFSAFNNDVNVRVPSKSGDSIAGPSAFPTNILLSGQAVAEGCSIWRNTADQNDTLALSDAGAANGFKLNAFAFEGSQIKTLPNQPPFVTVSVAVNTLTINTSITYDISNILVFSFSGTTDAIAYTLNGFIFGSAVFWVTHAPAEVTATVNNASGNVQLVFGNLTASVPVINVSGMIRHV